MDFNAMALMLLDAGMSFEFKKERPSVMPDCYQIRIECIQTDSVFTRRETTIEELMRWLDHYLVETIEDIKRQGRFYQQKSLSRYNGVF